MQKFYNFAGVDLLIDIPDDKMYQDDWYLAPFRVDGVAGEPHRFHFRLTEKLKQPQGKLLYRTARYRVYQEDDLEVRYFGSVEDGCDYAYARAEHNGKEHTVWLKDHRFPGAVSPAIVLNCIAAERLIAGAGGFVLHCSFVDIGGRAVLFTAPSGTGKSTQGALWEKYRGAEVIDGDRAAVRIENGTAFACGVPFAGSSGICKNRTLPLAAIVYLSQGTENIPVPIRGFAAFRAIWEGCSVNFWDECAVRAVSEQVQQVCRNVKIYHFSCTPDETAVKAMEEVLYERKS